MDFFGAQDAARRKTWQLALLFGAAVLCLVLLTNALIAIVYGWAGHQLRPGQFDPAALLATMPVAWWYWITAGVVGAVALASGYKYLQLRSGGRAVAESLGGHLIPPATDDLKQRRLRNVVEEMAIASGVPVPPVYLIEEPSINAFAAGFGPDDAVIGVNRGTLDHLNRDELQGVIAHEFSHILNGDSRINLRLIAALHGILFIGLVGRGLLHGVARRGSRRRSSSSSGGAPALALGLGLLVIGYTGTFFGNVIKAAVSRQRELLADAASVQFTRNPAGIAGALKKIGGLSAGSTMSAAAAGEVSHIFFGQASRSWLNGWLATHPPLERRIRAVDPHWNGRFPVLEGAGASAETPASEPAANAFATTAAGAGTGASAGEPLEIHASPDEVTGAVGQLNDSGLDRAAALIGGLPAPLVEAAHDPFTARALVYALVLDQAPDARDAQLATVAEHGERGMSEALASLTEPLSPLNPQQRLTLLEMSMPALKALSDAQYRRFTANLVSLIKADQQIDLLEWVLHRLLVKELKPHFEGPSRRRARHDRVERLAEEAAVLISALARESRGGEQAQRAAFRAGLDSLGIEGDLDQNDDADFARLNRALAELRLLKPLQKPRLIKACAATVLADGATSPREAALLQGIAATLDCPLPPSLTARD